MASELAANTMNAHGNIEFGGQGHRPVSGMPEFWLYLRTCGSGRELVCKIFDSEPGWDAGEPLPVGAAVPAGPDSVRGRGPADGGWPVGRALGSSPEPGQARSLEGAGQGSLVRAADSGDQRPGQQRAAGTARRRAIAELAAALADRGLGAGLVPVTELGGDLAVLSVSRQLTVWCRGEVVWWQEPDGGYDRLMVTDLVEATERIVCAYEELIGQVRRRGRVRRMADSVGQPRPASSGADGSLARRSCRGTSGCFLVDEGGRRGLVIMRLAEPDLKLGLLLQRVRQARARQRTAGSP